MSFNRVILLGRLAAEPELKQTATGIGVCTLRLAVDGPTFNKESKKYDAIFVNVIVWNRGETGKLADRCADFLSKGRECMVEGKLNIRSYDDKEGLKKYVTEVVADNVRFIGGKPEQPKTESEGASTPDTTLDKEFETAMAKDNLPF